MRTALLAAPLLPALLLPLAACAAGGATSAGDRAGPGTAGVPTAVPPAAGPVRSRDAVLVMDRGDGPPEVCLGAVAESWPPQCGGPPVVGWDWSVGGSERQGRVQWGSYVVTGTWDGRRLRVLEAVPGEQAGATAPPDPLADAPAPRASWSAAELEAVAAELAGAAPGRGLAGVLSTWVDRGRVVVGVVHDDGSLQAWADEQYGAGVVVVTSALVPADA